MLKECVECELGWLTWVIKRIWQTGVIPKDWRRGIILPFFEGKISGNQCTNCHFQTTQTSEQERPCSHVIIDCVRGLFLHIDDGIKVDMSYSTPAKLVVIYMYIM